MSVINTNTKSIVAQNALTVNNRSMSKTMEQLSTGKRINSAADDAAGLAISSKMTSQIKGLNQAVRNANDGISMLQTAEGAMVEVTNMMQRMRELAVQSANDTNTTDDRSAMNLEFQQLKEETNRITKNTQWNGMNILDGSTNAGAFKFQVGANANQTIDHTINQLSFSAVATGASTTIASAVPATKQETTFTVGSTSTDTVNNWKAGDVISLKLGSSQLQYTVKAADLTPATGALDAQAIAVGVGTQFTEEKTAGKFTGISIKTAATAGVIVFTGEANATFDTSVKASSGSLASLDGLSITDSSTSNQAITGLDSALKNVNSARAEIGVRDQPGHA